MKFRVKEEKISREEIQAFEEAYNYTLPESYIKFMLKNNGGVPKKDILYIDDEGLELGIAIFYSIKYGKHTVEKVMSIIHREDYLSRDFMPFARDMGSCNYLISMRAEDQGTIHTIYSDSIEPRKLCESFDEFLDHLEEDYFEF